MGKLFQDLNTRTQQCPDPLGFVSDTSTAAAAAVDTLKVFQYRSSVHILLSSHPYMSSKTHGLLWEPLLWWLGSSWFSTSFFPQTGCDHLLLWWIAIFLHCLLHPVVPVANLCFPRWSKPNPPCKIETCCSPPMKNQVLNKIKLTFIVKDLQQ